MKTAETNPLEAMRGKVEKSQSFADIIVSKEANSPFEKLNPIKNGFSQLETWHQHFFYFWMLFEKSKDHNTAIAVNRAFIDLKSEIKCNEAFINILEGYRKDMLNRLGLRGHLNNL